MVGKSQKTQRIINVLALVSACAAIYFESVGNRAIFMFLKPLTTILIMSLLFFVDPHRLSKFKYLMMAAFSLCLLGDILLLFDAYFVYGLAAFLLGHILFASGFIKLKGFYFHPVATVGIFAVGTFLFFWLRPDLGAFMVPVALYVFVICFMATQGVGLYMRDKSKAFGWIAMAVLLFMLSDTLIAIAKFKAPFAYSSLLILGTYWLSIGLIANASFRMVSEKREGIS